MPRGDLGVAEHKGRERDEWTLRIRCQKFLQKRYGTGIVALLLRAGSDPVSGFHRLWCAGIFFNSHLEGLDGVVPLGGVAIDIRNTKLGHHAHIRRRIFLQAVLESLQGFVVLLESKLGLGFLRDRETGEAASGICLNGLLKIRYRAGIVALGEDHVSNQKREVLANQLAFVGALKFFITLQGRIHRVLNDITHRRIIKRSHLLVIRGQERFDMGNDNS